ncbi:hypothetical protein GCM10010411_63810 [Actinomadura fulvescens]|uniref:Uncharacterized protein n=1 Tax=Actinomadura fulvescens TaxID=46160 RepID=A0ABP6CP21_9ACTN
MFREQRELGLSAVGKFIQEQAEQPPDIAVRQGLLHIIATPEPLRDRSGIEDPAPGHVVIRL